MDTKNRIRTAVIVTCVAIALGLMSGAATRPRHEAGPNVGPPPPCALIRVEGEEIQAFSRRLIRCAAGEWAVPGGARRAVCIATRESGLIPTASSRTGAYLGLFQHSSRFWPARYREWARAEWGLSTSALNGRTNAIVTIRMVHSIGRWAAAGWPVKRC